MGDRQLDGVNLTISEGDEKTALYIRRKIIEYNMQKVPLTGILAIEPLNLVLKNSEGEIVGGINARTVRFWGKCYIDIFWIDEQYRGTGYGSKLLQRVEELALERGCTLILLDSSTWILYKERI